MNRASAIAAKLLELPTGKDLLESPQYFKGPMVYQRDSKFRPISMANYGSYSILGQDNEFTYAVDAHGTMGFIFFNLDIENPAKNGLVPVMTVLLRDSRIKGYKQAHRLRIREAFSRKGVASRWYFMYVKAVGGIVSDFEHLEGGKLLWKSFLRTAELEGLNVSLVDSRTNKWFKADSAMPDDAIWSLDTSLHPLVLVLEKYG